MLWLKWMRILDTLYYSVYRFGRSLGQPHLQAKAIAGGIVPVFFVMAAFFLSFTWMSKWCPRMLPHKNIKSGGQCVLAAVLILTYFIYVKKGVGNRIISEYENLKNQKPYVWLGAVFSLLTLSSPVLMGLLWRVILKP
jgi:hypothetical protein